MDVTCRSGSQLVSRLPHICEVLGTAARADHNHESYIICVQTDRSPKGGEKTTGLPGLSRTRSDRCSMDESSDVDFGRAMLAVDRIQVAD